MYRLLLIALAMAAANVSTAFTFQPVNKMNSLKFDRSSRTEKPLRISGPGLRMSLCLDQQDTLDTSTTRVDRHADVHLDKATDPSDDNWALQLFDDSTNLRGYVCRCIVDVVGLDEAFAYAKTMQTHKHGKAVIGEFRQEHAEHFRDSLKECGLVCEIFQVNYC
mmetsp:Transcript_995/g.2259  ORF Transcript_995/g.2259 Transcript_995/m.2259 type:complete len:164 (-) Transcript_995:37-528(-)